jgi:hypothetical protein
MIKLTRLILVLLSCSVALNAQQVIEGAPAFNQFATYGGGGDEINLGTLDIHRDIPLRSLGAYGPQASAKLVVDTGVSVQRDFNLQTAQYFNVYSPSAGPILQTSARDSVFVGNWNLNTTNCSYALQGVLDHNGTYHLTPILNVNACNTMFLSNSGPDGWAIAAYAPSPASTPIELYAISPGGTYTQMKGVTGIFIQPVPNTFYVIFPQAVTNPTTVFDQHGNTVHDTLSITYSTQNGNNTISASGSLIDALGNTVLTASLPSANVVNLTYAGPNSTTSTYVLTYVWRTIDANYGCPSNTPVKTRSLGPVPIIANITMPDQSTMVFSYEPSQTAGNSTGRINAIKLTTGATISYTYQGGTNGFNCSDGSTAGFKKTTPDGVWTFSHTAPDSTTGISTTTVTAPSNDYKVYTFVQSAGTYPQQTINYPVQAIAYSAAGVNLGSTVTCYNGTALGPACSSPSSPFPANTTVTQRDVYTYVPGVASPSRVQYVYDGKGRPTLTARYDFGATGRSYYDVIQYGSWNSTSSACQALSGTIQPRNTPFTVVAPVCAKQTLVPGVF